MGQYYDEPRHIQQHMPRLGPGNGSQFADRQQSNGSKHSGYQYDEKRSMGRNDSQDSYERIWGSDQK